MAEERANARRLATRAASTRAPIATADIGSAVWQRDTAALKADNKTRDLYPSNDEIAAALADLKRRAETGEITSDPYEILDASLGFLRLQDARA